MPPKKAVVESDSEEEFVDAPEEAYEPAQQQKKPRSQQQRKVNSAAAQAEAEELERQKAAAAAVIDINVPLALPDIPEPVVTESFGQDNQTSRLMIRQMVLTNFKSYAGSQVIGPFHKSFSSIVGPNGSGKSNVIDALLFVFGFRAKKMRQDKLSQLIHNSTKYPELEFCSVEIQFQEIIDKPGVDAFEVVPNSSLNVCRTAYRNNASKYQINGKTSNYSEVTSLLKRYGVDLDHNRFLILQGEVELIAQMKPKAQTENEDGLLEYLEDIIGTTIYKRPIEDSGKIVEQLNDERAEKLNRLKYVEKEKNALEEKKNEAQEFIDQENTLTRKQNQLFQLHLSEARNNVEILKRTIDDLTNKMEEEKAKFAEFNTEIKEIETRHKSVSTEYEALGKMTNDIVKEFEKFERDDVKLQENKKHIKSKVKKLAKTLQDEKHAKSDHETWIANFDSDVAKRVKEVEDLETSLVTEERQLEVIRESLKGKTEKFQAQIETKQQELAPWNERISTEKTALDVAQSEFIILEDKVSGIRTAVEEAKLRVKDLMNSRAQKEKSVTVIKKQRAELERALADMNAQISNMQLQEHQLRVSVNELRQKADESRASLQSSTSRGQILKSLLKERDAGRLKGVFGRLGDLGVIDDKYDVAITTACAALNDIVVENVSVGQKCIEHLRRYNLGRARFICLDKLADYNLGPIATPENAPRLFDLVRAKDPKFLPAFYQVLRDTLVANDLPSANKIAYGAKRWRVVTLQGQVIDTSGTMSGGGTTASRGGMSSKFVSDISEDEVKGLVALKEKEEAALKEVIAKIKSLQKEVDTAVKMVPEMDVEIKKLEMDIAAIGTELVGAQKSVAELSAQEPDPADIKRMQELQKVITQHTSAISKLRQSSSKIEAEIKALQDKILEVGGVQFRAQKVKVDTIKESIEATKERVTKLQVEKTTREKNLTKVTKSIEKKDAELQELSTELENLESEIASKLEAAVQVRANMDQAKANMEVKHDELQELQKQLDEKEAVLKELRSLESEMKAELTDKKRELTSESNKISHWTKQIGALRLQTTGLEEDDVEPETLVEYSPHELQDFNKDELKGEIAVLQSQLNKVRPNLSVLKEYKQKLEDYLNRAREMEIFTLRRDEAKKRYDDLRKRRLDEFMAGFTAISQKLKEMYQMITLGGNAELELVDSLDPFSEGIIFSVMPPKKSWKNISNLSGGEKTLSSLALVFALHHFKPTPLYVMDEIDAALDFRNVSIVANYIKERTKNAQFIIISLRNNMFELADRLVGIYKTENCTKSISINPHTIAVPSAAPAASV